MKIKELRESIGMSRAEMAREFKIPLRTLENWDAGVSAPPEWAETLVIEKLETIAKRAKKNLTYKSLKENGYAMVHERDHYDGGIYLYTEEYWSNGEDVYIHEEHSNYNRYTGENKTYRYGNINLAISLGYNDELIEALENTIKK